MADPIYYGIKKGDDYLTGVDVGKSPVWASNSGRAAYTIQRVIAEGWAQKHGGRVIELDGFRLNRA